MREGWYERQRREQVAQGMRAFQAKTVLLTPVKEETTFMRPEIKDIVEIEEN